MIHLHTEASQRACLNNDVEALSHIVPQFLSPNSRVEKFRIDGRPYSNVPFLCIAISAGSYDCFRYLIDKGATTYFADLVFLFFILMFILFLLNTPLHYAARYNQLECLKTLLENGDNPNADNRVTFIIILVFI